VDTAERTLIVHYAVESVLGDAAGKMVRKEQSQHKKR
jgi:hypothetical protein